MGGTKHSLSTFSALGVELRMMFLLGGAAGGRVGCHAWIVLPEDTRQHSWTKSAAQRSLSRRQEANRSDRQTEIDRLIDRVRCREEEAAAAVYTPPRQPQQPGNVTGAALQ